MSRDNNGKSTKRVRDMIPPLRTYSADEILEQKNIDGDLNFLEEIIKIMPHPFNERMYAHMILKKQFERINPKETDKFNELMKEYLIEEIIRTGADVEEVISYVRKTPEHIVRDVFGEHWEGELREKINTKKSGKTR